MREPASWGVPRPGKALHGQSATKSDIQHDVCCGFMGRRMMRDSMRDIYSVGLYDLSYWEGWT